MRKLSFLFSHPEIQDGAPVFFGTRVRYETFCDYMRIGVSIEGFLEEFPSVSEDQAKCALELCMENLPLEAVTKQSCTIQDLRREVR